MRLSWKRTKHLINVVLGNTMAAEGPSLAVNSRQSDDALNRDQTGFQPIDCTEPQDIFLVGFPKSGNTWMQHLVAGLLYGVDTRYLTDRLTQLIVPNVHGAKSYKRLSSTTFFKSHSLPLPEYRRVVYLIRDGRDAMVSYFHMLNAVTDDPVDMREMVVAGSGLFPCKWHEHIEQWTNNPFGAQILLIRYEDLHSNPEKEMFRLCDFAGIERSAETIRRCIDGNSFTCMQSKELEFGWDNSEWNSDERFVRRGVIGSYKDEMPDDIIAAFEELSGSQLSASGYCLSR